MLIIYKDILNSFIDEFQLSSWNHFDQTPTGEFLKSLKSPRKIFQLYQQFLIVKPPNALSVRFTSAHLLLFWCELQKIECFLIVQSSFSLPNSCQRGTNSANGVRCTCSHELSYVHFCASLGEIVKGQRQSNYLLNTCYWGLSIYPSLSIVVPCFIIHYNIQLILY